MSITIVSGVFIVYLIGIIITFACNLFLAIFTDALKDISAWEFVNKIMLTAFVIIIWPIASLYDTIKQTVVYYKWIKKFK